MINFDKMMNQRSIDLNDKIKDQLIINKNQENWILETDHRFKAFNNNIALYSLPFRDIRIQNNFANNWKSGQPLTIDLNNYQTEIPENAISIEVEIYITKSDSEQFGFWTFG